MCSLSLSLYLTSSIPFRFISCSTVFVSISFLEWPLRARYFTHCQQIEFITIIYCYNWIFNFLTQAKWVRIENTIPFSRFAVAVAVVLVVLPTKPSNDDEKWKTEDEPKNHQRNVEIWKQFTRLFWMHSTEIFVTFCTKTKTQRPTTSCVAQADDR